MLLTFLTIVTRWSRSKSNFYALIGQNLTGEFMRKIYADLETCLLIAQADRVLCHLVVFLTVFFYWMYKMKYSCHQDSSVIRGWFVYCAFGWEIHRLSKSLEMRFRMASFSKLSLLALVRGVRGLKSIKWFWPHLMALRNSISTQLSTGKPEQLLSLMLFFPVSQSRA